MSKNIDIYTKFISEQVRSGQVAEAKEAEGHYVTHGIYDDEMEDHKSLKDAKHYVKKMNRFEGNDAQEYMIHHVDKHGKVTATHADPDGNHIFKHKSTVNAGKSLHDDLEYPH